MFLVCLEDKIFIECYIFIAISNTYLFLYLFVSLEFTGNEDGHFAISENSGEIKTASPLMSNDVVMLIVQASIQQNDSLTDRCNVAINILNHELGHVSFPQ